MPKTDERRTSRYSTAGITKAIAHPRRTDILTVLHDGPANGTRLCEAIGVPWSKIGHHIKALLTANAIEVAWTDRVGNHDVIFYRQLTTSTYLVEDLAQLKPEQRHEFFQIVVQSIAAESLAALGAGHFADDPRASAAWDRVSLDEEGFSDLSYSCEDFIENRLRQIAAEADKRMRKSGELPKVYVGGVFGFKRSRTDPATSAAVADVGGDLHLPVAAGEPATARDSAAGIGKAIAHPVRTDILTVLHDGPASKSILSKEVDMPISGLSHHIETLLDVNAIEEAFSKKVGNHDVVFYQPLATSTFLEKDLAQLTPEQRHEFFRVVLQSITAESLAALRAGHFADDPRVSAAWDRVLLDDEGFSDLDSSCTDFISRLHAIAAEADKRMQTSGELPKVYVGGVLGFKRSRTEPATSAAVGSFGG